LIWTTFDLISLSLSSTVTSLFSVRTIELVLLYTVSRLNQATYKALLKVCCLQLSLSPTDLIQIDISKTACRLNLSQIENWILLTYSIAKMSLSSLEASNSHPSRHSATLAVLEGRILGADQQSVHDSTQESERASTESQVSDSRHYSNTLAILEGRAMPTGRDTPEDTEQHFSHATSSEGEIPNSQSVERLARQEISYQLGRQEAMTAEMVAIELNVQPNHLPERTFSRRSLQTSSVASQSPLSPSHYSSEFDVPATQEPPRKMKKFFKKIARFMGIKRKARNGVSSS
jgi:hypothetical protein